MRPIVSSTDKLVQQSKAAAIVLHFKYRASTTVATVPGHSIKSSAGKEEVSPRSSPIIITAGKLVQQVDLGRQQQWQQEQSYQKK